MKLRTILSLFDGISCGQVALKRAGIEYDKYYASEIEKRSIWITQYNFPNTIQLGDVEKWGSWNIDWGQVDLLMGGSPCQNLSLAGNRKGLEGEESRLFYVYVDILNHIRKFNPNVKFLFENVESMPNKDKGIINSHMGCNPIMINSSLVSGQNRKRYYWFNWSLKNRSLFGLPTCSIPQPENKYIMLKDILESGVASMDKSITLCASDHKGFGSDPIAYMIKHQPKPYACELLNNFCKEKYDKSQTLSTQCLVFDKPLQLGHIGQSNSQGNRIYSVRGKSVCLSTNGGGKGAKTGLYKIDLPDGEYKIRQLTPIECERLQTLDDNYTEIGFNGTDNVKISKSARYMALGNGWTVDVIVHIFSFLV